MKNNTIGKISIATAGRAKTLKNKSSDLHTTMDFGSVMCGKLQRVIPGSTINVGTKERVLLTSLVAPCFGRMSLKAYHTFVPFSEITKNYAPMMAGEVVHRGSSSFVPSGLPSVQLRDLSLFVLFGSQLTIYCSYDNDHYDLLQIPSGTAWDAPLSSLPNACQTAINDLQINFTLSAFGLTNSARIFPSLFGNASNQSAIALSNPSYSSFFDYSTQHPLSDDDIHPLDYDFVSLRGADYIYPTSFTDGTGNIRHYLLAFRLSSFGRRLRKNLIGCGWQFNLESDDWFSVLPLISYYKAYFDTFGLTLYQNWEESYAYSFMQQADLIQNPAFNPWAGSSSLPIASAFRSFMYFEFGSTFFTDEQDFASSHIRNTAVAPQPSALISSITTDVDGTHSFVPNIDVGSINPAEANSNLQFPNGHAYIKAVNHGHLDSKLLMRLYRSTNAQTIAGRRIAELLRAQGLGAYVDECKSHFIGSWSLDLNVYDLPSQSDTYQNAHDGMRLGEFGAFGKSSGEHPMVRYETSEDGYFITLLVVVPKGGYSETVDPDALCVHKYDQYNPDYDSLGYEYNKKMCVVQGSQPWSNQALNAGSLSDSFGLAPRYFHKKFGRNVINGDFSLRSTRASYLPFCLEKVIDVGEQNIGAGVDVSGSNRTRFEVGIFGLMPKDLPVCGNVWRYPTRYEWISRFNRIFYNDSSSVDAYETYGVAFGSTAEYEFFHLRDDNFVCHIIFEMNVYDQMLPVQDSYETSDEEKHADASMSKA